MKATNLLLSGKFQFFRQKSGLPGAWFSWYACKNQICVGERDQLNFSSIQPTHHSIWIVKKTFFIITPLNMTVNHNLGSQKSLLCPGMLALCWTVNLLSIQLQPNYFHSVSFSLIRAVFIPGLQLFGCPACRMPLFYARLQLPGFSTLPMNSRRMRMLNQANSNHACIELYTWKPAIIGPF